MRLPHLAPFARDPLLFITTCTSQRRPVLANCVSFSVLVDAWRRSTETDGWQAGRFVVMPDHVHLFARPTRGANTLSKWMKKWKSITARVILKAHAVSAPLWQSDYFDHFLRSADSYAEKWDYVRHNPVRSGLVSAPEDWPWQGVIHDLSF